MYMRRLLLVAPMFPIFNQLRYYICDFNIMTMQLMIRYEIQF